MAVTQPKMGGASSFLPETNMFAPQKKGKAGVEKETSLPIIDL